MSLSREKVNHLSQLIVRNLEEMPGVTLRMPSNVVRLQIVNAIQEALRLEEEVDFAVRQTLASLHPQDHGRQPGMGRDVPETVRAGTGQALEAGESG